MYLKENRELKAIGLGSIAITFAKINLAGTIPSDRRAL